MTKYPEITRLEYIDKYGRQYVAVDLAGVEVDFQDDGQTMKIFINRQKNNDAEDDGA